jgi:hypothetical protein
MVTPILTRRHLLIDTEKTQPAMMKFRTVISFLLMVVLACSPAILNAQQQEGVPDGGGDPDTIPAPIDGGVSILVATAIAYGVHKAHENKTQKKDAGNC